MRGRAVLECGSTLFLAVGITLGFVASSRPLLACSVAMCGGRGVEAGSTFAVIVKHQRVGLPGAKVLITASKSDNPLIAELTDGSGRAMIKKLPPGDYWISVTYLGIGAGGHCFHVRSRSSMSAKATFRYRWGDYGVPMRAVNGSLQEWQSGKGGTPIWNLAHGVTGPVEGATALLENALTREVLRAESDGKGVFGFGPVPDGTYVLHIEGGATAHPYEPTDMIVTASHTATRDSLVLTLQENGCGVSTFSPQWR